VILGRLKSLICPIGPTGRQRRLNLQQCASLTLQGGKRPIPPAVALVLEEKEGVKREVGVVDEQATNV
jgi:hypothetical protein